jgi:hypothetical protein
MEDLREPDVSKNDITILRDEYVLFGLMSRWMTSMERFDGEGELGHMDLDAVAVEFILVP